MELELAELTEKVIGAAIAAQKELGPGFLESIYENALRVQLAEIGIDAEFQKEIPVHYHGILVGTHRLDALADGELIVVLKAIKALEDIHFAQVRSYLPTFPTFLLSYPMIPDFAQSLHQRFERTGIPCSSPAAGRFVIMGMLVSPLMWIHPKPKSRWFRSSISGLFSR